MKYYNYVNEMQKEAAIKIPSPKAKFKSLPLSKKIGVGIGAASTGMAVGGAAIDGIKEVFKPGNENNTINTGFKNGVMKVNPETEKSASTKKDSLESSKMKYLPAVTGAATLGLVGAGVATGKVNKDLLVEEGKRMGKKVSKAYNVGSKVVNQAVNIAKSKKTTEELKKAFEEYKKISNNTIMEFNDFKELNEIYESWKRKTGNSSVDFASWAKRNAGKIALNKERYKGKSLRQKLNMAGDAAIKGAALGTTTSLANFAVHELGDEYFNRKDKDEVRRRFREDWNNNFTDNLVAGKRVNKKRANTGYKTPKQKIEHYQKKKNNEYKPKYINKIASAPVGEYVNHADDMAGVASKQLKGKALIKDIIKHDVVKPAVTGVAYVGAPALVAASIKRDRNTMRKIEDAKTDKIVLDIPDSTMKKKASFQEKVMNNAKKIKSDYIPENLGQEFVRSGIRGVSMAAPIAIIANTTNRNLRGNMEKLEERNKQLKPVDKGNVRITVERRVDNA